MHALQVVPNKAHQQKKKKRPGSFLGPAYNPVVADSLVASATRPGGLRSTNNHPTGPEDFGLLAHSRGGGVLVFSTRWTG
jgi:hypothetical protein